jgi:hypothetical protein
MRKQIAIEEIHPSLRETVREFLFKCKYPFEMELDGAYSTVGGVDYYTVVHFFDPMYPILKVGSLRWNVNYATGKASTLRVITRGVLNTRYADNERRKSVDTINEKRAVKLLVQHVTPFALSEIASKSTHLVTSAEQTWRTEFTPDEFNIFRTDYVNIYKEFKILLSYGVSFVTPEFRAVAEQGVAKYEKWFERHQTRLSQWFVKFTNHGEVLVLAPTGDTLRFNGFEQLPEAIQQGVGMLKILSGTDRIPGLGVRVSEDMFWVLKKED